MPPSSLPRLLLYLDLTHPPIERKRLKQMGNSLVYRVSRMAQQPVFARRLMPQWDDDQLLMSNICAVRHASVRLSLTLRAMPPPVLSSVYLQ